DVATFVTEFFGHGQTRQRNTQTVTGWFVHLTEHHGYFRIADVIELNNTGFGHLVVEVVTFTSTLTHTSKHGQTTVLLSDVVNQFEHVNGFTYTRTAEQANFTTLSKRANQVNNLNTCF